MAEPLAPALLPSGVTARIVPDVNGLAVQVLEAGPRDGPMALLLHGFPELAYSWRRVIPALAAAGFRVVAPDVRGYGRTTGWDGAFGADLAPFGLLNLVRDQVALLAALGRADVALLVGHDAGSSIAAACALARPDVFRAVVLMSAPFAGPPGWPLPPPSGVPAALARLDPPRTHYQWYYSTAEADADMLHAPQGLHAFLRAYYHHKSADWPGNQPHAIAPDEIGLLPTYYVMHRGRTMPESVEMPGPDEVAGCRWLPDAELAVYAGEYARTGFQGALNWYRGRTGGLHAHELALFAGRTIDVPALFIAGAADWGTYQTPGALDAMRRACPGMTGVHLVDGAGHWVQQEQPEAVSRLLLEFARG